jgi:sugar lactone lactonase YvrE
VKVRDRDRITTLVQDKRLRWPDKFSEGPDGAIYVTSSHIQDMTWFKPENGPRLETQLWRIQSGQNAEATGSVGEPRRR